MANLDSQRKEVQLVIDFPINNTFKEFEIFLSSCGYTFAYIVHDKDIHETDVFDTYQEDIKDLNGNIVHKKGEKMKTIKFHKGDLKTKHLHLVISSIKRHRLKYFLAQVCDILSINENQVSIQPCDSVAYAIQYLIHKNDSNKYQYNVTSIRSNLSEGNLYDYLNEDVFKRISTEDIIRMCIESNGNKLELISKLGIARYTLYRNTINDIYNNIYLDIPNKYR